MNDAADMKREAAGLLSAGESEQLEKDRDRSVRTRMERERNNAAEYMRFEHEQLALSIADPQRTRDEVMVAAHSYAQAIARYTLARKAIEMCGWCAGDYPEWYSRVMDAAIRGGH